MYSYSWDSETGGLLLNSSPLQFSKEPRPVYYKELDILGFDQHWKYDRNDSYPYMWAEANSYFYRGRLVAKTKGGSLYTAPELIMLEEPEPNGAPLRFVDVPAMVEKNHDLLEKLVQDTIKKIYNTYVEYRNKVDVFYVAFSGGKDSVVAFDLVQRALPHNKMKVLFGDTGMEFPDTYDVVDKIKEKCEEEGIDFLRSKCEFEPEYTWSKFGPPAQTMRWCCSVHKTAPQVILLRKYTENPHFRGMAFTGIRGDESASRSEYDTVSLGEKIRGQYSCHEMVVYKDLKRSNFFSSLGLPSFLRDWVLKKFEDDEGNYDIEEVTEFIQTYLPRKEEWISIKNRIIYENERVKILTKVGIDIDIKTGDISFSLPAFGLSNKETIIEPHVWDTYKEELTNGQETWGVIELGYRMPDDTVKPKILGKIKMTGFANFCPYVADLDFFKDARAEFTVSEWIDVVLGAIDYNAQGYKDENEKLAMLARLLPFVEKRLNLLELAPKGTGKSYVFGNVSKYGLLTDGGKITRTKMFYDKSRRAPGFIVGNDFVAIDEVKLVTFDNINEMRSIMQGYMERGRFNVDGYDGESFAGVVLLGNISIENMDEYTSMFSELPVLFQESALVDRIHGFIKGWDIPKMKDNLKASGWALNSEYFCTVMHMLRDDASYRAIVDALVDFSDDAYVRHTEAVKRIATAYLKLLFPNVRTASDVNPKEFMKYCLRPAIKMRKIIWRQLSILDAEYKNDDKLMPEFTLKEIRNEA